MYTKEDYILFMLAIILGLVGLLAVNAGIWLHDRFREYRQPRQPVRFQRVGSNEKAQWDKVLEIVDRRCGT